MELIQRKRENVFKKSEIEKEQMKKVMQKFETQQAEVQEDLDLGMQDLVRRVDEKSLMYASNLEYKVTKAKDSNRLLEQKTLHVRH